MQDRPEDHDSEGQHFDPADMLDGSRFETSFIPGKPFEIELRNEDDLEMCDLLHSTMAVMPDSYFQTSSW